MNSKEKELKGLKLLRDFELKQIERKLKEVRAHRLNVNNYNKRIKEVSNQ